MDAVPGRPSLLMLRLGAALELELPFPPDSPIAFLLDLELLTFQDVFLGVFPLCDEGRGSSTCSEAIMFCGYPGNRAKQRPQMKWTGNCFYNIVIKLALSCEPVHPSDARGTHTDSQVHPQALILKQSINKFAMPRFCTSS